MASGRIPDTSLSASTTYGSPGSFDYAPSQARLGTVSCWCGTDNGTWPNDWIQVAFGAEMSLTGIAIERGSENPADILTELYLEYSHDGVVFTNHTDLNGNIKYNVIKMPSNGINTQFFWLDAFATKYIRIRASKLLLASDSSRFCLRFELFGCNSTLADKDIFPAGLENQIMTNSQISASSSATNNPAFHARLNFPNSWCPVTQMNEWLQVDLGLILLIKGIATQGAYGRAAKEMVSSYLLSYGNDTTSLVFLQNGGQNLTFTGNNKTAEDPVFNAITTKVVAKYLRLHPLLGYKSGYTERFCMRIEVFVTHPECSTDLTSEMQTIATVIPNEAYKYSPFRFGINAASSWCLGYQAQAEYLRIDFVNLRLVSGVAVAGSSDYAGWVTKFDVKYGLVGNNMRVLRKALHGSMGRTEVAVNWLDEPIIARYIEIAPKEFVGSKCLRVSILGCTGVPSNAYNPVINYVAQSSRHALIYFLTNKISFVNGVVVKYSCDNSSYGLPCRAKTTKIFSWNEFSNSTVNLTDLQPWTKYRFTLRLVFNTSLSNESSLTNFQTSEARPRQAPGSCKITTMTTSSITISWTTLPSDAVNGVLLGYQITVKSTQDSAVNVNISTSSFPMHSFHYLNSNTGYSISISAFNSAGLGTPCIAAGQTLPKVPSAPINVTLVKLTKKLVKLEWAQPLTLDGKLEYYVLSHKELSSTEQRKVLLPNFTYFYLDIDNQTGIYEFKVRAYSAVAGLWSNSLLYWANGPPSKESTNKGSSHDSFSRNSMIALVTCASAVMFFVLSCILGKAAHEKYIEKKRRKTCFRQWRNLQRLTINDFLETQEKSIDNDLIQDRDKLRRLIEDTRLRKLKDASKSRAAIGPAKYFETVSASAQSSGKRKKMKGGGGQNNLPSVKSNATNKLSHEAGPEDSPQLRKVGIDNTAFGSSHRKEIINKVPSN
eukprot:gene4502-20749_t